VCLALFLTNAGCALDERSLLAVASSAGAGSGSAGGDASAGDPGVAGGGGAAGEAPLPRCFYAASTVEADCATLVENPGFALNAAAWTAENLGITEGWFNADASSDPMSGSLVVTNLNYNKDESAKGGIAGGGSRQCLPAASGSGYDLAADIFIPSGQGAGFDGDYVSLAALSVFFYSAPNCDTQTIGNFTSQAVQLANQWVHVEGSTKAPKDTRSMAVRLNTLKPSRQYQFEAHFDNIFVREHATP
jgi:hypothetical protein